MSTTETEPAKLSTATAAPVSPAFILVGNGGAAEPRGIRNSGASLRPDWFEGVEINASAAERRVAQLPGRRSVSGVHQAAWLVRALQCLDLTTLAGDDTPGRVRRLCAKARRPLRDDIVRALGLDDAPPKVGAVCVYPLMVAPAIQALDGSGIPVAAVATGASAGQTALPQRLADIRYAVGEGASEIEVAVRGAPVLTQDWAALYDEVSAMREACGPAHLTAILAAGEARAPRNVYRAAMVAMMAGADFVGTSTGRGEEVAASLAAGLVTARAIRDFCDRTGQRIGLKPAGGIATAAAALAWLTLAKEELGRPWLEPDLLRLGATALLSDIERQLEHHVTGRYAAAAHHALA